jgi:hypothetical protein
MLLRAFSALTSVCSPTRLDSPDSASYYASVLVAQFMAMQAWRAASRFQIKRIPESNGKLFIYFSGKDAE